ncbi:unnamed protein product [Enterobius vermicularis]|uniref:Heparan-sulfate 6-O-sulfotransferase n=1 Tax=Enterobius vermicularis TaxID=51028 RepID=A0A0N4VCB4_ENTVE|nr:unnamed protein product [Enterobius vermicularis]
MKTDFREFHPYDFIHEWKRVGLLVVILFVAPLSYFLMEWSLDSSDYGGLSSFYTPRFSLDQMREFAFKNSILTDFKPAFYARRSVSFNRILGDVENRFDMEENDVIVFLHVQKTAGTSFERYLVRHLNISLPCFCRPGKKRCQCYRPGRRRGIWLFSRFSTGWICGLHADFTELYVSGCVDNALDRKEGNIYLCLHRKRRYFYTTFLREPVSRFISEYRHVERGATWLGDRHVCNGRPPSPEQLPMCFDPDVGWDGVSLDDFLACPFNLAFNRQTRMLADLTLVHCYDLHSMDPATRDKIMLESAKNNLKNFAFFGLKEHMSESQWMFEQLFQLKFTRDLSEWQKSKSNDTVITEHQMRLIRKRNELDLQLYAYAEKLFFKRLKQMRSDDYFINNQKSSNISALSNQLAG